MADRITDSVQKALAMQDHTRLNEPMTPGEIRAIHALLDGSKKPIANDCLPKVKLGEGKPDIQENGYDVQGTANLGGKIASYSIHHGPVSHQTKEEILKILKNAKGM